MSSTVDEGSGVSEPPVDDQGAVERLRVVEAKLGTSLPDRRIGRYEVSGVLGEGGMGVVLEAVDPALDRRVALKVMHRLDPHHTARLLREAQALARLSHPNVVQVYEVGEVQGRAFVAMELVEGETLREFMDRVPPPDWRHCVDVFMALGEGLSAAHDAGLIHRDFKPSNAIIDGDGRPRVLDFGLARRLDEREATPTIESSTVVEGREESLTHAGAVMGTPAYMPFEQMEGRDAEPRSDQFSFCVSLYEAVHGERPFDGRSLAALRLSVAEGHVRPPPAGRRAPARLRAALLRGLAPRAEQRWPSMAALLEQLRAVSAPPGRHLIGGGLVLGLLAVGVGLGVQRHAEVSRRCSGARAELEQAWGPETRSQVEAALRGTGVSYAADTWGRVERSLDDYAASWVEEYTQACEATAIRHEQSESDLELRMRCLRQRKAALQSRVSVLARADETVVEQAVDMVLGLPDPVACRDVDRERERERRNSLPEEPERARDVEAQREQLAYARALGAAGRYEDALTLAEAVVTEAELLEYRPLLAEAMLWRGGLRSHRGLHVEAEADLERAYALAIELALDDVAVDAARNLAFVVGHHQARFAEGLIWGTTALPLAERSAEPMKRAKALSTQGSILYVKGEYSEAEAYYRRALEVLERAELSDHPEFAARLSGLGVMLEIQGEFTEAEVHYRRAVEVWESALGPEHPDVAAGRNNLGTLLYQQGNYADARAQFLQALEIQQGAYGEQHLEVAASLNNLGIIAEVTGELDEAEGHYRRGMRIQQALSGPAHPDVAMSWNNLGLVYQAQGRYADAEHHHRQALEVWENALGPEHLDVAMSSSNLGNVIRHQGRYAEAEGHLRRALEIVEGTPEPDAIALSACLHNLGGVVESQGRLEDAAAHYERALALRREAQGEEHPGVAEVLVSMSQLALAQGDSAAARMHGERALAIREAAGVDAERMAQARLALAYALGDDLEQRPRARELARRARDTFRGLGPGRAADEAAAARWLAEHP